MTGQSNFLDKTGRGTPAKEHNLDGYAGVLTSPPYGDARLPPGVSFAVRKLAEAGKWDEAIALVQQHEAEQAEAGSRGGLRTPETIRRHIEAALAAEAGGYAGAEAAVTSPPYGGHDDHGPDPHPERMEGAGTLFRGYSAALTSPPYAGHPGHADADEAAGKGIRAEKRCPARYTHEAGEAQIGNLRDRPGDVDAAVSSPPWETGAVRCENDRKLLTDAAPGHSKELAYGDGQQQLGNLKGESYCSAMLRVYQQLHAVLKPGGVVCLVTKNPVKGGKIRRLDLDTVRLMAAAGFDLIEHVHAMLTMPEQEQAAMFGAPATLHRRERKSFFKRLHEKKNPHLRVDHEDVLFFRKKPS